jgi:hypothetical protein
MDLFGALSDSARFLTRANWINFFARISAYRAVFASARGKIIPLIEIILGIGVNFVDRKNSHFTKMNLMAWGAPFFRQAPQDTFRDFYRFGCHFLLQGSG